MDSSPCSLKLSWCRFPRDPQDGSCTLFHSKTLAKDQLMCWRMFRLEPHQTAVNRRRLKALCCPRSLTSRGLLRKQGRLVAASCSVRPGDDAWLCLVALLAVPPNTLRKRFAARNLYTRLSEGLASATFVAPKAKRNGRFSNSALALAHAQSAGRRFRRFRVKS